MGPFPPFYTLVSHLVARATGFHASHVHGKETYERAKATDKPHVVVFNHVTFGDVLLLHNHLDNQMPFVAQRKNLSGPFLHHVANALQCILVPALLGERTVTEQICERVTSRKAGQPILAIAPDGGMPPWPDDGPIAQFRSGAFVPRAPVIPVVLRYFPEPPIWQRGVSFPQAVWDRLTGPPARAVISVLPPIHVSESESTEEFKARVRNTMMLHYEEINV